MKYTYIQGNQGLAFIGKIRDAMWNYPIALHTLFISLKKARNVVVVLFVLAAFSLIYSQVFQLIDEGKGIDHNTLYIGVVDNTPTYDPLGQNTVSKTINSLIFNPLFTLNNENVPQPVLAKDWKVNASNTIVDFALKSGIYWQDGKKLSADDVIYSFNLEKKVNTNGAISKMSIQKLGNLSFEVATPGLDLNLWEDLFWPIYPVHTVYSQYEEIGTGAYIYEKFDQNKFYLKANPKYFNGVAKTQQIILTAYPDQKSVIAAYQEGQINIARIFDPTEDIADALVNNKSDHIIANPLTSNYSALMFNMNRITDANIRQGINYAINKNEIRTVLANFATIIDGPINPGSWAYTSDGVEHYNYSRDAALNKFNAAGYTYSNGRLLDKSGNLLTLEISYDQESSNVSVLNAIKKNLQDIGVDVVLLAYNHNEWSKDIILNKSFQIAFTQIQGTIDPDPFGLWQSAGKANITSYSNKSVDQFLDLGRNIIDQARRQKAYALFQKNIMADAPAVFLYSPNNILITKPNISGVHVDNAQAFDIDVFDNIQYWEVK